MVSPLHCDGSPHPRAANEDGAVLQAARLRKERTCPELVGPRRRARLVVLAGEVGGALVRGNQTVPVLAGQSEGQSEPPILQKRVEQAWRMRWGSILGCAVAHAYAASLLELKHGGGADGDVPLAHDVISEFRHAGLA